MINNKEKEREKEKDKINNSNYTSSGNLLNLPNNPSSSNNSSANNTPSTKSKKLKLFSSSSSSKKDSSATALKIDIIEKVINHIEQHGIDIEGVFRQSGNMDTVKTIVKSFNHSSSSSSSSSSSNNNNSVGNSGGTDLNLNFEIHNVTNALKYYLRSLDPPLIPYEFFLPLLDSQRNEDIQTIRNIFWKIPSDNRYILTKLVGLLVKISENSDVNKMNSQNLSIVFGPTILKPRSPTLDRMALMSETQLQCGIMQIFIDDFNFIFNDTPVGLPKSFTYPEDQNDEDNKNNPTIIEDDTLSKISTYSTPPSSQSSPPPQQPPLGVN